MTTLLTYAQMAQKAYRVPNWIEAQMPGWETWRFGEGNENTTGGFHGCIYKKDDEAVVTFRGTGDWDQGKFRDLLADVRLAVGICPRQASAARDLLRRAQRVFANTTITLTGHSLGGGLAQIVSHWYKVRFVTFNAPPMMGTIQKTKLNWVFATQKAWRSFLGTFKKGAPGFNYRLKGDPVSASRTSTLGHYGALIELYHPTARLFEAHKMANMIDKLVHDPIGLRDPFAGC